MNQEKEIEEIPFYDLTEPQSHAELFNEFNDYPTCPYCQAEFTDIGNLFSVDDEDSAETVIECEECGKQYLVVMNLRVIYSSYMIKPKEPEANAKQEA